jgi:Mg2+ and Co2+ transporter CorA
VGLLGQCAWPSNEAVEDEEEPADEDESEVETREASMEVTQMMAQLGTLREITTDAHSVYQTIIRFVVAETFEVIRDAYDPTAFEN